MIHPDGYWMPDLAPKGQKAFNCYKRYQLYSGPRFSSKSITALHRLMRHIYECPMPKLAIVNKSIKGAKAGGIWVDFTETIVPQWVAGGAVKWVTKPKTTSDTKMTYFEVRSSATGRVAQVQLHSLEKPSDIVKFKGNRYSCFYFPELDQFDDCIEDRITFAITRDQLRMVGLAPEQHLWLADTNPPRNCKRSWMHKLWYLKEGTSEDPVLRDNLHVTEFTLDDNIWMPEQEKKALFANYAFDQNLLARYYYGKWVEDVSSSIFREVFRPGFHVIGNTTSADESEWELIVPDENTFELCTGTDIGDVYHAGVIAAKRSFGEMSAFDVIDELVCVDEPISLGEFSNRLYDKISFWENYVKDTYGRTQVMWHHWTDRSASRRKASLDLRSEIQEVYKVTRGRLRLRPANKPPVRNRVMLARKLLFDNRLFVSKICRNVEEMFSFLPPDRIDGDSVKDDSIYKHPFDALTYLLAEESPRDMILHPQSRTDLPRIIGVS